MEGTRSREKPRIMMLDDIKADEKHEKFKRRAMSRILKKLEALNLLSIRTPMMLIKNWVQLNPHGF